jgi:2-C-methyl-D-erythritol 4-phosphate cytidylyltransferase
MDGTMSDTVIAGELPSRDSVTALILGAGRGERFGNRPKAMLELGGRTLLERAFSLVRPYAGQIIAGLPDELIDEARKLSDTADVRFVPGGKTRQETVSKLVSQSQSDFVILHEVARPFATPELLERLLESVRTCGAVTCAVPIPVRDGLAVRDGDVLSEPLDRERVVAIQVPQAFRRDWLAEASSRAATEGWFEPSTSFLLQCCGRAVKLVDGDRDNVKLTWPSDWDAAVQREQRSPPAGPLQQGNVCPPPSTRMT